MSKIGVLQIGPKAYPCTWSLYVATVMEDRHGSDWFEKMQGASVSLVIDLVHAMICSGCTYVNEWKLHPDGIELDENGQIFPCSKDAVAVSLATEEDLTRLMSVLNTVMQAAGRQAMNSQLPAGVKKKKPKR